MPSGWEPAKDDFGSGLEVGSLYRLDPDKYSASWGHYTPGNDAQDICHTSGKFHKDSYLLYLGCFKPDKPYPTKVLLFYHFDDNRCYFLSNPHRYGLSGIARSRSWPQKIA